MTGRRLGHRARGAAAVLLAAATCVAGCRDGAEDSFGLREAAAAHRALARTEAGVAAFRAGDYDRAAAVFQGMREALPGPSGAATAAALLGLDGGAPAYRRLLSSVENNLGLACFRARRFDAAEAALLRAVAADPVSARALANLGLVRFHQRRYAEAVASFEAARRAGDSSAELHLDLGRAARRSGDRELARDALRSALAGTRGARDPRAWGLRLQAEHELAVLTVEEGHLAAAIERLEALVERAPGLVEARYELARALARAGRKEAADAQRRRFERDAATIAGVQRTLAATPGRVEALHAVARTYHRLGLLHLAEVHYRQVLARHPGDAVARDGLRSIAAALREGAE